MSTKTRQVKAGNVLIGGGAPVSVQSMTNTDTADVEATLSQIRALTVAGADIVRVSVYNEACAEAVRALVDGSPVPLVADIHFDYKLAIKAVENGIHKLRINPGNIGGEKNVRILADCVKSPSRFRVRIGVNGGSLEKDILAKGTAAPTAQGMVESALAAHSSMLEHCEHFYDYGALPEALRATCRIPWRPTGWPARSLRLSAAPGRAPKRVLPGTGENQERHRHRFAAAGRHRRYDPRFR